MGRTCAEAEKWTGAGHAGGQGLQGTAVPTQTQVYQVRVWSRGGPQGSWQDK